MPDLPLKLLKSTGNKALVVYISGDGGWNDFSTQLVNGLNKNGLAVLGLDSHKYFWSKKTPTKFAQDLQKAIVYYQKEWNKKDLIIIGYSFGADVGSFLPSNLDPSLKENIQSMVLLSPSFSTSFEIKLMDMLNSGGDSNKEKYKVYPELLKIAFPVTCVFGSDDDSDFKPALKETKTIHKIIIKGNHHYNDDFSLVLRTVLLSVK
ncbi:alpha/beta fold hydrolase [Pedobacter sp. SD-b]|uniref:Alpha/beta fold hydrolase n=1 Tax=Pedobacter segetis TaxID=2793069 RepID=A0ABS1BIZ2_9SPHI|nr:alpha/beta fold hydrolase [Pedobacter segetis]MBK0382782.1 alpha/beta fold hydrolase [Pedobacter segetis]